MRECTDNSRVRAATVFMAVSILALVLWPSCGVSSPEVSDPTPAEEISRLKAVVSGLTRSLEDMMELNARQAEENEALKSMLLHCMEERMDSGGE